MANSVQLQTFLNSVCSQVKWKRVHAEISKELKNHIEDQANEYLSLGLSYDEAQNKAIKTMGDPVEVGKGFNDIYYPQKDTTLIALICGIILSGIGVQFGIMINNGSSPESFVRFLLAIPLGITALVTFWLIDYTAFCKYSTPIYVVLLTASILFTIFPKFVNGSNIYIYYFSILLPPVFSGVAFNQRLNGYKGLLLCCAFYLAFAFVFIYANVFSAFILFSVSGFFILLTAILKNWFQVNKPYAIALIAFPIILICMIAYGNYARYLSVTPEISALWSDLSFFGQSEQTAISFQEVNPFTIMKWHTQFVILFIFAKGGILLGSALIVFICLVVYKMFKSALNMKSSVGYILSISISASIAFQVFFYSLANLGIEGLAATLPVISFGGISYIINMALMGLMLSTMRYDSIVNIEVESNDNPIVLKSQHTSN